HYRPHALSSIAERTTHRALSTSTIAARHDQSYASFCCSACTRASISCWILDVDLDAPDPDEACAADPSPTCATDSPFIEAFSCSSRFLPAISLADCCTSIMRPCTEFWASSAEPSAVLYRFSILSRTSSSDGVFSEADRSDI